MTRCKLCGKSANPWWGDMCNRCAIAYERGREDERANNIKLDLMERVSRLEKTNKTLEALINKLVKDEKVEE